MNPSRQVRIYPAAVLRIIQFGRLISFILTAVAGSIFAQQAPFQVKLEPVTVNGLPAVQSYAFAQHLGKWLIVGGRTDGLHPRQPFAAFDSAGHSRQILVVDPKEKQFWSASLEALSVPLQEHLSSTNMEFVQSDRYLYLVGGYGYSPTLGDHKTYSYLTAIDVPALMDAVIHKQPIEQHFRQVSDSSFAVTGGQLKKVYGTYYLVGGHQFDGRYNPKGFATFTQAYTNQIRRFRLKDDGKTISVVILNAFTDSVYLHRRDLNVVPQILSNGGQGFVAFSGVFQSEYELPHLNCVNIDPRGYAVIPSFSKYYNHYHCPVLPLYAASEQEMHTVFFGGIAQYYDSLGTLVQDNDVPFVKTISRVTRTQSGEMKEYKLPIEMPVLLGAGAHFIPLLGENWYENDVFNLDKIEDGKDVLVGYIFGGIESSNANIFWINEGNESKASEQIFRVLIRKGSNAVDEFNPFCNDPVHLDVYPDLVGGVFYARFRMQALGGAALLVTNMEGKVLAKRSKGELEAGEHVFHFNMRRLRHVDECMVVLKVGGRTIRQKILLAR